MSKGKTNDGAGDTLVMRLYVAGEQMNSRLAKRNLDALCRANNGRTYNIEVVDVNKDPEKALQYGVFVTPALEILEPEPGTMIYGNLSNHDALKPFFPHAGETS